MTDRSDGPTVDPAQALRRVGSTEQMQPVADARRLETIPDEHRASVMRGLADLRDGRIATDAEVDAVYRRFGH